MNTIKQQVLELLKDETLSFDMIAMIANTTVDRVKSINKKLSEQC